MAAMKSQFTTTAISPIRAAESLHDVRTAMLAIDRIHKRIALAGQRFPYNVKFGLTELNLGLHQLQSDLNDVASGGDTGHAMRVNSVSPDGS